MSVMGASGRDFKVVDDAGRLRDRQPVLGESLQVDLDGLAEQALGRLYGRAGGDATGEVGDVGRVVRLGLLDDDRVAFYAYPFVISRF